MRQVLPLAGAVVGFFIGGPAGAAIGMSIGGVVGNAVDPIHITNEGPDLGELRQQTSEEGGPIVIPFGLTSPFAGNVIFCGPAEKYTTEETSGGKGGPKQTSITHHVKRTYAIGICRGPIDGVIRVWRNGKLVYDLYDGHRPAPDVNDYRGDSGAENHDPFKWGMDMPWQDRLALLGYAEDAKQHQEESVEGVDNEAFLELAQFYLGTYDQMPDPHMETYLGAGNVPPHRGLAYMVVHDEELTQLGGAVPTYHFQVYRELDGYTTSAIYGLTADGDDPRLAVRLNDLYLHEYVRDVASGPDDAALGVRLHDLLLQDPTVLWEDEEDGFLSVRLHDLFLADPIVILDDVEDNLISVRLNTLSLVQNVIAHVHDIDDDDMHLAVHLYDLTLEDA